MLNRGLNHNMHYLYCCLFVSKCLDIWIRIDSNIDNACYGLGPYLTLNVEALPTANSVTIPRQCDDNNDGIFLFNTSSIESDIVKAQNNVSVTYFDHGQNK